MEKKATGITGEIKDYLINSIVTTVFTSKKIKSPTSSQIHTLQTD